MRMNWEWTEIREVFAQKVNEQILQQWQQTYLEKLLCLLQCLFFFFYKDQPQGKNGNDFETDTESGFQNTPALRQRDKTYSAPSFDRMNFFNMANLFSLSRKPVVCYCFCEPIKTFFFDACQIARPALFSGPPNWKKPYSKHHISLFFRGPYCKLRILVFSIDLWPAWFALGP